MDIKIKKLYYYLSTKDGKYTIFLREEIETPPLCVTQLNLSFGLEEDAREYVKHLNEKDEHEKATGD